MDQIGNPSDYLFYNSVLYYDRPPRLAFFFIKSQPLYNVMVAIAIIVKKRNFQVFFVMPSCQLPFGFSNHSYIVKNTNFVTVTLRPCDFAVVF